MQCTILPVTSGWPCCASLDTKIKGEEQKEKRRWRRDREDKRKMKNGGNKEADTWRRRRKLRDKERDRGERTN